MNPRNRSQHMHSFSETHRQRSKDPSRMRRSERCPRSLPVCGTHWIPNQRLTTRRGRNKQRRSIWKPWLSIGLLSSLVPVSSNSNNNNPLLQSLSRPIMPVPWSLGILLRITIQTWGQVVLRATGMQSFSPCNNNISSSKDSILLLCRSEVLSWHQHYKPMPRHPLPSSSSISITRNSNSNTVASWCNNRRLSTRTHKIVSLLSRGKSVRTLTHMSHIVSLLLPSSLSVFREKRREKRKGGCHGEDVIFCVPEMDAVSSEEKREKRERGTWVMVKMIVSPSHYSLLLPVCCICPDNTRLLYILTTDTHTSNQSFLLLLLLRLHLMITQPVIVPHPHHPVNHQLKHEMERKRRERKTFSSFFIPSPSIWSPLAAAALFHESWSSFCPSFSHLEAAASPSPPSS